MDREFLWEVHYKIIEHIGDINESEGGCRRELNLISWNGKPPKYDIRYWSEDRNHYSRGITLHPVEMQTVIKMVARHMEEKK